MKKWHSLLPNWAIITMLTVIVIFNFSFSYYGFFFLSKAVTLVIIPLLLAVYFYRQRIMANIFFTIFFLYFLGMLFNALDHLSISAKLSESFFLGVYFLFIIVMIGKLRDVKFEGLVSTYLIVSFLVNAFFMYVLFNAFKDSFADSVILTLSISKGIALLIMAFLAFAIYLSRETAQSIIFLVIACCFVFSDVLSFITTMYIEYWLFDGIQKIVQVVGLLLSYIYVYNHQVISNGFSKDSIRLVSQKTNQISIQS